MSWPGVASELEVEQWMRRGAYKGIGGRLELEQAVEIEGEHKGVVKKTTPTVAICVVIPIS